MLLAAALLTACGAKQAQSPATTAATTTSLPANVTTTAPATTATASPGALQAEVAATGAGDIPDNQVFVAYPGTSFTMKFPEGWTQAGGGNSVKFSDKNNIVRVVIGPGTAPTTASVQQEIAALRGAKLAGAPTVLTVAGAHAIKVVYTTTSAPNSVTGKTVTLTVDRYELAKHGKRVVVDLGSPIGVDNVDAYRLMIQSLQIK